MMLFFFSAIVVLSTLHSSSALSQPPPPLDVSSSSRRNFLAGAVGYGVVFLLDSSSSPSFADDNSDGVVATRDDLLLAIQNQRPESEILDIIARLPDPSGGRAASADYAPNLDGAWKLVWSAKADAFSPLLKLPQPLRPESYQYLGTAAAKEVGEGRLAQGLTGGILGRDRQLWLSSGATTLEDATDGAATLVIQPPFRLQLGGPYGSNQPKQMLVEAGSDADFRKLNARTPEAQLAGKNLYKQLYLETKGAGSLRISTITAGDPVIVGAIFVHEKL